MQKKNWFARGLVILLIFFIATIVVISFFFSESKFVITSPIICLVAILVVLALSEIFDNFNVGNFLSLKKEHKKVEHELQKSEQENRELRAQFTNIVTNLNSNSNTTIFGQLPDFMERTFGIKKAQDDEVQKKKQEEDVHFSQIDSVNTQQAKSDYATRRRIISKIEDLVLKHYCSKQDINILDVYKEIKFSEGFIDNDPIMERNIIFDAYYKAPWQEELFIEICYNFYSPAMLDRFYHLLSKVYHYRNAKKLQAKWYC